MHFLLILIITPVEWNKWRVFFFDVSPRINATYNDRVCSYITAPGQCRLWITYFYKVIPPELLAL